METIPQDHSGMGVLSMEQCLERLGSARVGRIAFMSDGFPVIFPVNHGLDDQSVVFRTADGTKLAAADNEMPVAFEVDGFDADRRSGWSVLVRGTATAVDDPAGMARLAQLRVWPWADAVERVNWVRIAAHEITGRQIVHPYNY